MDLPNVCRAPVNLDIIWASSTTQLLESKSNGDSVARVQRLLRSCARRLPDAAEARDQVAAGVSSRLKIRARCIGMSK